MLLLYTGCELAYSCGPSGEDVSLMTRLRVCRNPPIHSFTGDRKKHDGLLLKAHKHSSILRFHENMRRSIYFLWTQYLDKKCV